MMRPKALISGGCGFVGRHFCRRLWTDGYDVTIVDDLSTGRVLECWPAFLRPVETEPVRVYYNDFREFTKQTSAYDFDLIVHLAAVVGGRLTIDGDPLLVATDLSIDATFFNWLAKSRTRAKVLYFSSSAAYPICEQTEMNNRALKETMIDFSRPLGIPDMTYGWAKLSGEFLAHHAASHYDIDVVLYRPFSGYGEDQDFTYPFPSIVRRVGQRESPLTVWGSGRQLRDFIHIDDVVDCVFASAWKVMPGDVLNLGSGIGTSFAALAALAARVVGHEAEIVNDPSKPEGVFARVADCARMFGFREPMISLEEGVERVYRYQLATGQLQARIPAAVA